MHSALDLIGGYSGLLIFEVAGKDYCLNDSFIFSTVKPPFEISRFGMGRGSDDQVIKVKDRFIPLIDLKKLLSPTSESNLTTIYSRVIVIEIENEEYGLLVDTIKELLALDSKYILDSINLLPLRESQNVTDGQNFIKGSLEIENKSVLLLDPKQIISRVTFSIN